LLSTVETRLQPPRTIGLMTFASLRQDALKIKRDAESVSLLPTLGGGLKEVQPIEAAKNGNGGAKIDTRFLQFGPCIAAV
jgi:hypothetical protein